jgi:hypothetical protein
VENVIREVKIFKILSDSYRNRRKNHGIKTNIVAGIVNMKVEKRNRKVAKYEKNQRNNRTLL